METVLVVISSLVLLTFIARTLWCFVFRYFGLWNPEHYHLWLWLPWRPLARQYIKFEAWLSEIFRRGKGANSSWASVLSMLTLVYRPGYVLLGRMRIAGIGLYMPIGFKASRHIAMIAGTGGGKTTLLITMLGLHRGNAFVIDPKGQITKAIARRRGQGGNGIRGMGKPIAVLDPYKTIQGNKSSSWNAMDELARVEKREGREGIVKYAMKMAEGIVPQESNEKPYFPKSAREFLQGLILHVYTKEPQDQRNLVRVRDLVTRGYSEYSKHGFEFLLDRMQQNNEFGSIIPNAAATMAGTGKSKGDVLSTVRSATKFLDLPEIRAISYSSDFSLEDLVTGELSLFLCAPTNAIQEELSNWFRVLTVMSLDLFEKINPTLKSPCLFAVDEMPSLGSIKAIEKTAPVMRSYGVRLIAIAQDIEKLRQAYPDGWRGFLGNADAVYWMATNEQETKEYISNALGKRRRRFKEGWIPFFRKVVSREDVDLLTPDDVGIFLDPDEELDRQNMIVTRFSKKALALKTTPYYRELPVYYYEADPDYKESMGRAIARNLLQSLSQNPKASGGSPNPTTNTTGNISHADAQQIFGLGASYTIHELDKKKASILANYKANPSYQNLVNAAYNVLRSKATI